METGLGPSEKGRSKILLNQFDRIDFNDASCSYPQDDTPGIGLVDLLWFGLTNTINFDDIGRSSHDYHKAPSVFKPLYSITSRNIRVVILV